MRRVAAGALVAASLLAGCGATSTAPSAGASGPPSGTVTVYAAASLQKTFTQLGQDAEAAHPGLKVVFVFAGSSTLVTQLASGASGDVLATADQKTMTAAQDKSLLAGAARVFATNHLVIATEPGNPQHITSLKDLTRSGLKVVVCAAQVPCGAATQKVTAAAGVTLAPASEEDSVTSVLGKVTSGEADAGLVYTTDASAAGDKVTVVTFPESKAVTNTYPIAMLTGAPNATGAQAFVDEVLSSHGQQVLKDAGFGAAPG